VENLLSPDTVRRVLWQPPGEDTDAIAARLTELGARPWQVELTAEVLADAIVGPPEAAVEDQPVSG
jgi:ribonuclease D